MAIENKLGELKQHLLEVNDLQRASSVLSWDKNTYMPSGSAVARGRMMSTLNRVAQEKLTSPVVGKLLEDLIPYGESLPFEHDDAALIRAAKRNFERYSKIPPRLIGELFAHGAETYQVWRKARAENDFKATEPYLEKMLDISRLIADCFPGYDHIADPLIDFTDYGIKAEDIRKIFAELRTQLVPIVEKINAQEPPEDDFLHRHYPQQKQLDFSERVVHALGYDFEHGRLDLTAHPFEIAISISDVRITTRVDEHDLGNCVFSCMHEAGHGMYEQGIDPSYEGTPLARGTSSAVHESQSRTWENLVGRSRGFWQYYFPELKLAFPEQLADVSIEKFYRAVNKVQPSLIRTEADEVTYNLHVMIRFDLELDLLEGKLDVKDLPEAWTDRYDSDLGVTAPDDRDGVLQDVHWYSHKIGGAFQGYTLGNILSAMFYERALQAHPEIPQKISEGEFGILYDWLQANIYRYGSKYTASELIEKVTGGGLDVQPLIRYLRNKYGELYEL